MQVEAQEVPRTYDEAVAMLARWHGESGPADVKVYLFPDPTGEAVQLAEVSEEFQATGRVAPFTLGRSATFPFVSSVALLTPVEWNAVINRHLPLPSNWDLPAHKQVWP